MSNQRRGVKSLDKYAESRAILEAELDAHEVNHTLPCPVPRHIPHPSSCLLLRKVLHDLQCFQHATAAELCLRKTGELVYNYIGQGDKIHGVTNDNKEKYRLVPHRPNATALKALSLHLRPLNPT